MTIQCSSPAPAVVTTSASVIDASQGKLILTACSFKYITNDANPGLPLISVNPIQDGLQLLDEDGTANTFDHITMNHPGANNEGGAVFRVASTEESQTVSIDHSSFIGCSCNTDSYLGGVIYISLTGTGSTVSASSLSFSAAAARHNAITGDYVYVEITSDLEDLTPLRGFLPDNYQTTDSAKYQYKASEVKPIDSISIDFYVVQSPDPMDEEKDDTCTSSEHSTCTTYSGAIASSRFVPGDVIHLYYDDNLNGETVLSAEDTAIPISSSVTLTGTSNGLTGDDLAYTSVALSDRTANLFTITTAEHTFSIKTLNFILAYTGSFTSPLFSLEGPSSSATLSLNTVSFSRSAHTGSDTETKLSNSLINAASGAISLTSVSAEDITLDSYSLIAGTPASVAMSGCSFTSITKATSGNGAVLSMTLSSTKSLTFTGTNTFTGCEASGGYGVIALTVESTATSSSLTLATETFYSEGTTPQTWTDFTHTKCAIIFTADELSDITGGTGTGLEFGTTVDLSTNEYKYYAKVSSAGPVLPLKYYITKPAATESTFYLSAAGFSFDTCGSSYLPCSSLAPILDLIKADGKTISIDDGTYSKDVIPHTQIPVSITISGNTKAGVKPVTEENFFTIANTVTGKTIVIDHHCSLLRSLWMQEWQRWCSLHQGWWWHLHPRLIQCKHRLFSLIHQLLCVYHNFSF